MSASHGPKNILANILLEMKDDLLIVLPDLHKAIEAIGSSEPVKIQKLKEAHQSQKHRQFTVVDLISSDASEMLSVPEHYLLYALSNRLLIRNLMNADQRKRAIKIMASVGKYSFNWLSMSSRGLIKMYEDHQGQGDKALLALRGIQEVNGHFRRYFWGLGQIISTLNLCEILDTMAKNNCDNQFRPQIIATQSLALEYLLSAKGLIENAYSQDVFGMFIPDKKIKNIFQEDPEINKVPDDNALAIAWVEEQLRNQLSDKKDDLYILENRAKKELTEMKEILYEITEIYTKNHDSEESKSDASLKSPAPSPHQLFTNEAKTSGKETEKTDAPILGANASQNKT